MTTEFRKILGNLTRKGLNVLFFSMNKFIDKSNNAVGKCSTSESRVPG